MHRTLLLVFLVLSFIVGETVAAQEEVSINPVITGPTDVAVGRTIVLDASSSRVTGDRVNYVWFLGDSRVPISRTVEALYTPEKPGVLKFRLVMRAATEGEESEAEAFHEVTVYERKIVLIADDTVQREKLVLHEQSAKGLGVYLRVLRLPDGTRGEEEVRSLLEEGSVLGGAEVVVLWTDGVSGIQALMQVVRGDPERGVSMQNQTILLITGRSLALLARSARGPFAVLRPQQILVTRKEALNPLLAARSMEAFLDDVSQRDIDILVVNKSTTALRPWNLLSSLVTTMLTHGVSSQTVILLLMLPIIATILTFLKQVIGMTTFGLYTPAIVALSFLALGVQLGLLFLIIILTVGYTTRSCMQRFRLLYIPKVAIILTAVSITLLIILGVGTLFGLTLPRDTVFILLILSTLSESFLNLTSEEGWFSAVLAVSETVFAALLSVFIVQWGILQSLVLAYPELVLLTLFVNVFLGRWTGLRLVEYFRFREVFAHLQEE